MKVDLLLHRDHFDNSEEGLNDIVGKLVALGYNDFHHGRLHAAGNVPWPEFKYLCLELTGYEGNRDVCWSTRPDYEDVTAKSLEEFFTIAEQNAK